MADAKRPRARTTLCGMRRIIGVARRAAVSKRSPNAKQTRAPGLGLLINRGIPPDDVFRRRVVRDAVRDETRNGPKNRISGHLTDSIDRRADVDQPFGSTQPE